MGQDQSVRCFTEYDGGQRIKIMFGLTSLLKVNGRAFRRAEAGSQLARMEPDRVRGRSATSDIASCRMTRPFIVTGAAGWGRPRSAPQLLLRFAARKLLISETLPSR
jgi:hypothetical protein